MVELKCVFETESQCSEFLECLGEGYVPLKFAYVGSAAHTHDTLATTEGYAAIVGSVKEEIKALSDGLSINGKQVPLSLVELGPGNGLHTGAFISELAGVLAFSQYQLIDYSTTLMDIASQRLTEAHPNIEFYTSQIDLENHESNLAFNKDDQPKLVLMFGNTLGNVECWKKSLRHLFKEMKSGDIFYTSYAVYDPCIDHSEYLDGYLTGELSNAALEPLVMTGADINSIEFSVFFDAEQRAVVGTGTFLAETVLSCSGKEVCQAPGSRVRCFLSRRFLPDAMEAEFESVGFDLLIHEASSARSIGYLMAKKT